MTETSRLDALPDDELPEEPPPGIVESLRSMVATLLQILHTRVELVTTELQEEMHRVTSIALWGAVALASGALFVLMLAATVIIAAGPEYRLIATLSVTGVFLVVLIVSLSLVKSRLHRKGGLLASSREELRRDRDALRRRTTTAESDVAP